MTYMVDASEADKNFLVKSTLIHRISDKCKDSHPKDIETAIKHILDSMNHTLNSGGRIEIRGFGAFSLRYRPPRKAHNPKTGEKVATLGKYVIYFRAGKDFKGRINTHEQIEETADAFA